MKVSGSLRGESYGIAPVFQVQVNYPAFANRQEQAGSRFRTSIAIHLEPGACLYKKSRIGYAGWNTSRAAL